MTTAVMKQALEALEILNLRAGILADYEDVCTDAITAMRTAISQPDCRGCENLDNWCDEDRALITEASSMCKDCTNGDKFQALPIVKLYKVAG